MEFGSSRILRRVDWYVCPEDEGTAALQTVGNYSPVDKTNIPEDLNLREPHLEDLNYRKGFLFVDGMENI